MIDNTERSPRIILSVRVSCPYCGKEHDLLLDDRNGRESEPVGYLLTCVNGPVLGDDGCLRDWVAYVTVTTAVEAVRLENNTPTPKAGDHPQGVANDR